MKRASLLMLFVFLLPLTMWGAPGAMEVEVSGEGPGSRWVFDGGAISASRDNALQEKQAGIYTSLFRAADGTLQRQSIYVNPATGTKVRLYVIGDSTASPYNSSRFPRMGWAQVLQGFFNPDSVEVVNMALSGRSSKSYYTDPGGWKTVRNALNPGDYLFIQFGHNDEKSGNEDLYTAPYTTYKEYLKRYVDTARSLGAIPVLLTPIHRNRWNGDQVDDSHGDYPPAMRQLAQEEDVPLIDLTRLTESLFESYGEEMVTREFFMNLPGSLYRYYPEGNEDNTHLQDRGAYEVAKLVHRSIGQPTQHEHLVMLSPSGLMAGFVKVYAMEYDMGKVGGTVVAPMDSVATLHAVEARGYLFDYFSMNGQEVSGETPVEILIRDSVQVLTAYFKTAYRVRITIDPDNRASYQGSGDYGEGDTVNAVVVPDEGYRFLNWTRNDAVVSEDSLYTFVMGPEDVELVAHLEQVVSVRENRLIPPELRFDASTAVLQVHSQEPFCRIRMYDSSGRLVIDRNVKGTSCRIGMSGLDNGMYVLHVMARGQHTARKFIKYSNAN